MKALSLLIFAGIFFSGCSSQEVDEEEELEKIVLSEENSSDAPL